MKSTSSQPFPIRWWLAIVLGSTAVAYVGFFLSLSNTPFTDAPNHLARAVIMRSLWFDPHSPYQGMFSASRVLMPYMLPDLVLILLLRILGVDLAYPVFSALTMLIVALAVCFYARQMLATSWAFAAAVLCSWYFATSYLFILGFFAFQWGLAAAFVALGALQASHRYQEKAGGWVALYWIACFLCYGAHLAAFAILAAIVGAVGLIRVFLRQQSWRRLAGECLPFAVLAAYHLLVPAHPETAKGTIRYNGIVEKLIHFIESMFIRESWRWERPVLILFGLIVVGAIWFGMHRGVKLRGHWQLMTICGLAAALFFALPASRGPAGYLDQRALPFFFIPLLLLALGILESAGPSHRHITLLIAACALLAILNLGSLARFLLRQNREVTQYRQALHTIPARKMILPIRTPHRDGNTWPLRHVGPLYAADLQGYTPYLFGAVKVRNISGDGPSGYFTDISTNYRPSQDWYPNQVIDWEKIAGTYDYVVVTRPWNPARINLSCLELYYENSMATVFRVRR